MTSHLAYLLEWERLTHLRCVITTCDTASHRAGRVCTDNADDGVADHVRRLIQEHVPGGGSVHVRGRGDAASQVVGMRGRGEPVRATTDDHCRGGDGSQRLMLV